jgi:hypothetical protein
VCPGYRGGGCSWLPGYDLKGAHRDTPPPGRAMCSLDVNQAQDCVRTNVEEVSCLSRTVVADQPAGRVVPHDPAEEGRVASGADEGVTICPSLGFPVGCLPLTPAVAGWAARICLRSMLSFSAVVRYQSVTAFR